VRQDNDKERFSSFLIVENEKRSFALPGDSQRIRHSD
jgi:hypothetical protein